MLGLGFWEIIIIGLVALIVVGPENLPDFAKSVARFLNELKRTASDLKKSIDEEKDIFKDDIDKFQELAEEIKRFPEDKSQQVNNPIEESTNKLVKVEQKEVSSNVSHETPTEIED